MVISFFIMLCYDSLVGKHVLLDIAEERIKKNNDSWSVVCVGKTGSGKSYVLLKFARTLAHRLGVDFDVSKHVHFSVLDFLKAINSGNLQRGSILILEEASVDLNSKRGMSQENVDFGKLLATIRHRGFIFLFNLPRFKLLDKTARELVHFLLRTYKIDRVRNLCFCHGYEVEPSDFYDSDVMKKIIRVIVNKRIKKIRDFGFGLPLDSDVLVYEQKKRDFTDSLTKQLEENLTKKVGSNDNAVVDGKKPLTPRQTEVLEAYRKAKKNKAFACEQLNISRSALDDTLKVIQRKGHFIA